MRNGYQPRSDGVAAPALPTTGNGVRLPDTMESERDRLAKLVEQMIYQQPFSKHPAARMSLAIAARSVRRGRHLTDDEKMDNLANAVTEWDAEQKARS